MVEFIRALSNPEVQARIDAAVEALDRLLADGPQKSEATQPLPLGHRVLGREILRVLGETHDALRPVEVRMRVEQRLGRPIYPHSVVGSLNNGSRNPKVPIVRVDHGRYRLGNIIPE